MTELDRRTIGNALVVHVKHALSAQGRDLALTVAEDTEHDLVVVDLPTDTPGSVWEDVAALMPRPRRGVRLVIGGRGREATALAAQWVAERIGRPVLVPDGTVFSGVDGGLFVDSGRGSGWLRLVPGRPAQWVAKRFPKPAWDTGEIADATPTSSTGIAEPVPGGVWLRQVGYEAPQRVHRERLLAELPCQPEVLAVVLGCPGTPPTTLDDAARFWMRLPERLRPRVRFVPYGPLTVPPGTAPGQALADHLGERVVCYPGLPVGSVSEPTVRTVVADGGWGWTASAWEVAFTPRGARTGPLVPELLSHGPPVPHVPRVAPGTYWYAPDAVVEIVQSGLWMRPPETSADPVAVRAEPTDPCRHLVVFDTSTEALAARMRELAEDLVASLDEPTRRVSELVASAALTSATIRVGGSAVGDIDLAPAAVAAQVPAPLLAPAVPTPDTRIPVSPVLALDPASVSYAPTGVPADPAALVPVAVPVAPDQSPDQPPDQSLGQSPGQSLASPTAPATQPPRLRLDSAPPTGAGLAESPTPARVRPPDPPRTLVRRQPSPAPRAAALVGPRGVDQEREWLRQAMSREFAATVNSVSRVLSEYPGFHDALARSSGAVLTDAVAVRLYLGPDGDPLDQALRSGGVGPHVPFARCVVSGLSRLPSHRGPATFRLTPSPEEWAAYHRGRLWTEWGFVNALTTPCSHQEGEVDVLVWSMTGRRTRLLEPETDPTPDRVLFVPGTSFTVLDLAEPGPSGRGRVLLRELASTEIGPDGRVAANRRSLDDMARAALDRFAATVPGRRCVPDAAACRFRTLPGLCTAEGDGS